MSEIPVDWQLLVDAAILVQQRAYAPYSHFQVGAALMDSMGKLHIGCNVENASYGLSMCAERNAIAAMISAGDQRIAQMAVASNGGVTPCGACRQVISEFGEQVTILLLDSKTLSWRVCTISELLPRAFGGQHLS